MIICVPSENENGLDAKVFGHFGSAPYFTIVDAQSGSFNIIKNSNAHHSHGMCHPLSVLSGSKIDIIVCKSMGARAVQKLNEANIRAYLASGERVSDIINKYKNNELEEITLANACAQHGCHE